MFITLLYTVFTLFTLFYTVLFYKDFLGKIVDSSNCVRSVFTSCIKYLLILMDKIITGNVLVISGRL